MATAALLLCFTCYLSFFIGSAAQNCIVDNLTVQANFDFEKFTGKWFLLKNFPDHETTNVTDFTHHYVQTRNDTATVYAQKRNSLGKCQRLTSTLTTSDSQTGKLVVTHNGTSSPYWVLETDYTQYAFVYGCYDVSDNGTCSGARAWILSRTPSLPQNVLDRTSTFYQNICIEESKFEMVTQNNECRVMPHWNRDNEQNCSVNNIVVQDNFDIDKFGGTWFETSWLPFTAANSYKDYQHHYFITADGKMTGYVYGRAPDNPDQCFYEEVNIDVTSTPGKMIITNKNSQFPYWVLRTDYTQYAVVYGCFNVSSDGSCYEARSWVWSRTPTLPQYLQFEVNTILQKNCINPSAMGSIKQDKACQHPLTWTQKKNHNCNFTTFSLASNLTGSIEFPRIWFGLRWLPDRTRPANIRITDNQVEIFSDRDGSTVFFVRYRLQGKCFYNKVLYKDVSSRYVGALLAGGDQNSFSLNYECDQVGSDGVCLSPRASIWSRTATLAPQQQYKINSILQELCLNPAAFISSPYENACPPQEVPECPTVKDSAGRVNLSLVLLISQLYVWKTLVE